MMIRRAMSALVMLVFLLIAAPAPAGDDGRITVRIGPAETLFKGAAWSLDEGRSWLKPGRGVNLPPGSYSLIFKPIQGWIAPERYPLDLKPNVLAEVTVHYSRLTTGGRLVVIISPARAVREGAAWSLDEGRTWHPSGRAIKVAAGEYRVIFRDVPDYRTPNPHRVALDDREQVRITAGYGSQYQPDAGRLRVIIQPGAAELAGAAWSVDAGTNWFLSGDEITLDPDTYRVRFRTLPGFKTPPDMAVNLKVKDQVTVTAKYQQY